MRSDPRRGATRAASLLVSALLLIGATGCKWVQLRPDPANPKQGDLVSVQIAAGQPSEISTIKYKINAIQGTTTSAPFHVPVNTCKAPGKYDTQLSLWGEATYKDGTVRTYSQVSDLTEVKPERHNSTFSYVFYLSNSGDGWMDAGKSGADAFINNFSSRTDYKYFWSEPGVFSSACTDCASNFDLVIAWGHGSPHTFYSGKSAVDLSGTAYGGCAFCNSTGDTKYLAFASCSILSLEDSASQPWWNYWFHNQSTRTDRRPFQGLHMVMGFRTLMVIDTWSFLWDSGDNADDFFGDLAGRLDDGWSVKDAWLYSAKDNLSFDDGNNRAAVAYLGEYGSDTVSTTRSDFIYGNAKYANQWVEFWE